MAEERLYIENKFIPLSGSLNPSITKALTDLSEPDKRKSTHTKTVSVPRSREADIVFAHVFEINATDLTFNMSTRAACRYEVDSEVIIEGYIRLKEIKELDNNDLTYECVIYGTTADFFATIREGFLSDLYASTASYEGLDIYDHILTKELQQLSWDTQIIENYPTLVAFAYGKGYVYPLVDYGLSSDSTNFIFTQVPCAIYEKEYLLRMISWAGFTLKSGGFFDTDDVINHLIIPASPEVYQLTAADIAIREFVANTPQLTSTGTTTSNNLPTDGTYSAPDTIIFTNEVSDPGTIYDNTTGEFTCEQIGVYDLNSLVDINATFTPSTGVAVKTTCDIHGKLQFWYTPFGGATTLLDEVPFYITSDDASFIIGARSTSSTPTYPDTDYMAGKAWGLPVSISPVARPVNPPDRYQLTSNSIPLNIGDKITVKWRAGVFTQSTNPIVYIPTGYMFVDATATEYTGSATLTMSVGKFYNKVVNTVLSEGNNLEMSKVIPKNVKMIDYFMWNAKRFNWIVDVNPDNPTELIIETLDDYYGSSVVDIHELIDRSKDIEHHPITGIDIQRYLYSYKPDTDHYNNLYTSSWQEIYGQRLVDVNIPYTGKDYKTEIGFSPTCMVAPPNTDRVLPTIYQITDSGPKPTKHNIRSLYYAGLKDCLNAWNHINYASVFSIPLVDTFTQYPYAGHWDDPYNPTLDINFGLVKEVFYDDNINTITATDNNLVNKYHSKYLREITDVESRIIKAYVHMRPYDFTRFTFDKSYRFDHSYFRLHAIEAYNPNAEETTLCVFLKLTTAPVFTPTGIPLDGSNTPAVPDMTGGNVDMTEASPSKGTKSYSSPDNNNYSGVDKKVSGENNYINSTAKNVEIYGEYNSVYGGTSNIKIHGSNNIIEAGVENVVLINTDGLTISESNVTYINGKIQERWVTKSATFTVDDTVYGYNLKGDVATVQTRLNSSTSEFIFKCIDSTNRVYIDASPYTFDSSGLAEFDLLTDESIRVRWNAEESVYNIIN